MIIIKLADGSFAKLSFDEHSQLMSDGIVITDDNYPKNLCDRVLKHLLRHKKEVTVGKLANIFRCKNNVIKSIISELETKGMVKTRSSESKYRSDPSVIVSLA